MRRTLERCPQCFSRGSTDILPVPGNGPRDAKVVFIAEQPGFEENRRGWPLCGKTGQEYDQLYLGLAGLSRSDVYSTNTCKCVKGDTRVRLVDGSYKSIRDLVNSRYRGYVSTIGINGELTSSQITGWYKSDLSGRELYRVSYSNFLAKGRGRVPANCIVTGDHPVLTDIGWVEASKLEGRSINTGTPGLSDRQSKFLLGMLLGDTTKGDRSITVNNPPYQREYVGLKAELLSNFNPIPTPAERTSGTLLWSTNRHPVFEGIWDLLTSKSISLESLVCWYLDDGALNSPNTCGIAATSDFKLPLLERYAYEAKEILGSDDIYVDKGRIQFRPKASHALCRLIHRYVPECLQYKLIESYRGFGLDDSLWESDNVAFYDKAVLLDEDTYGTKTVYCIDVKDTHNFITTGGVLHNCKWADAKDAPPPDVVRSCAEFHLKRELEQVNPEIVVLMGGISNSLLGLTQDIDTIHGTGRYGELLGTIYKTFSTYHPARGLHQTSSMTALINDFKKLKLFVRGELPILTDDFPNPGYYKVNNVDTLDMILDNQWDLTHMAVDTESRKTWNGYRPTIKYIPWSIQFSIGPTDAYFIRVEDEAVVERFGYHARKFRKVVMHNAQHDMRVLHDCDIDLDWDLIEDTMALAYHDGRIPKGLKALSYQVAGIVMRNFDDVVGPYGKRASMEYFERASLMTWKSPDQEPTGEMVTKKCPDCKGTSVVSVGRGKLKVSYECGCDSGYVTVPKMTRKQGIGQKVSRLITDYLNNPDGVDPVARWEAWGEGVQELINTLGPLPLPSVEMVPEAEILTYAGADAVACWRVYNIVKDRLIDLRRSFNGKI